MLYHCLWLLMPTSVSKARDNRTSKLGSRSSEMRWQRENKKKLSWWNIERQLKAFLFIAYSYSCCTLFFLGCYMIKWQWLKMLSRKGLWFSSGGKLLYSFLSTDRGCLNRMIIIMDYVLYTRYCFVWYGTYEAIFPFKFRKVIVITLSLSLSVCLFVRSNQSGHRTSIC